MSSKTSLDQETSSQSALALKIESQFNRGIENRRIFCGESLVEYRDTEFFPFQITLAKAISEKPIQWKEEKSTAPIVNGGGIPFNPFRNPDPELTVGPVGTSHLLLFNKFCVVPKQLLLITREFRSQNDGLDQADFEAVLATLGYLEERQVVFFNCGKESGASQPHKHLQIVKLPSRQVFRPFPDEVVGGAVSNTEIPLSHPNVPFKHYIFPLQNFASKSATDLTDIYDQLLSLVRQDLVHSNGHLNYNALMTRTWMMLIPRTSVSYNGVGVNSIGMLGILWVKDEQELNDWKSAGFENVLLNVGIQR